MCRRGNSFHRCLFKCILLFARARKLFFTISVEQLILLLETKEISKFGEQLPLLTSLYLTLRQLPL